MKGKSFLEFMAPYNRSYFESQYGEKFIFGISKPSIVLRYSLNHDIDDMNPVIVSSKIILLYTAEQPGQEKKVSGAKIISRLSHKDSAENFKKKLMHASMRASESAEDQLRSHLKTLELIDEFLIKDSNSKNLKIQNMNLSPFDWACDFS